MSADCSLYIGKTKNKNNAKVNENISLKPPQTKNQNDTKAIYNTTKQY